MIEGSCELRSLIRILNAITWIHNKARMFTFHCVYVSFVLYSLHQWTICAACRIIAKTESDEGHYSEKDAARLVHKVSRSAYCYSVMYTICERLVLLTVSSSCEYTCMCR
jgi:hypothetical protein